MLLSLFQYLVSPCVLDAMVKVKDDVALPVQDAVVALFAGPVYCPVDADTVPRA